MRGDLHLYLELAGIIWITTGHDKVVHMSTGNPHDAKESNINNQTKCSLPDSLDFKNYWGTLLYEPPSWEVSHIANTFTVYITDTTWRPHLKSQLFPHTACCFYLVVAVISKPALLKFSTLLQKPTLVQDNSSLRVTNSSHCSHILVSLCCELKVMTTPDVILHTLPCFLLLNNVTFIARLAT